MFEVFVKRLVLVVHTIKFDDCHHLYCVYSITSQIYFVYWVYGNIDYRFGSGPVWSGILHLLLLWQKAASTTQAFRPLLVVAV